MLWGSLKSGTFLGHTDRVGMGEKRMGTGLCLNIKVRGLENSLFNSQLWPSRSTVSVIPRISFVKFEF